MDYDKSVFVNYHHMIECLIAKRILLSVKRDEELRFLHTCTDGNKYKFHLHKLQMYSAELFSIEFYLKSVHYKHYDDFME